MNALPAFQEEHLESNGEQYTDFFHQDEELMPAYADTVIAIIEPYLAEFTERRRIEFTDMWAQTLIQKSRGTVSTIMDTVDGQQ